MTLYTKKRTIDYLIENNFPKVFIRQFTDEEEKIHKHLHLWVGVPEELYLCDELEQSELIPQGYEPLWDDGNFDSIYCVNKNDGTIRQIFVEGGGRTYRNYLELAADLVLTAWENEYEFIIELAKDIEFPFLSQTIEFLEGSYEKLGFEEFRKEFSEFIVRLEFENSK
ncbi:hypothetical protein [Marinicella meishanensis]|uniref:hypothetical protein n=1 Tax=Marinicella meishanensis TaxID=2873263 RepID=UPI001CBB069D|nr:hypothetical protein [Marinicella sp. NBU2979]